MCATQKLLSRLLDEQQKKTEVFGDNEGMISLSKDKLLNKRTMEIDMNYNLVCGNPYSE